MREGQWFAVLLRACAAGTVVATCLVPVAGARSDARSEPPPAFEPPATAHTDDRLDSQLGNVAAAAREHGVQAALRTARANGLDTVSGRIRVVVEASPADARNAVAARGGIVEATAGELTEALVPAGSITAVSGARGVAQVRAPYAAFTLGIDSEGIASVEADVWHTAGATGAGAKVAVIDLGFAGLAGRQATGDLPAGLTSVDYCGSMGAPEKHGTAVAEIVYEMAPAAQLYAICVDSEVDLANASAYAKAAGITIVNHSVGWYNTSRGDGTGAAGTPDAIVASARTDGILWVNAAGNAGEEHWSGTYLDPDADGFHNFSGSDEGNSIVLYPGEEVCGFLKWDAWPTTREDYDLLLVRDAIGALETISANDQQNGPLTPTEAICFANPYNTMESFSFLIERWSATTSPRFDLFVTIGDALQYTNAAGSVVEPATSPSALAVGAVAWWDNVLEPYSSVGPTIDGRVKPDLAAPSAVTSAIYDPDPFTGTSSAAPHVAGAAALLRAMFPLATPSELQSFLEEEALDVGPAGADTLFGAGVLLLPASPPLVTTFAPAAGPTATDSFAASGSVSPRGMATTYRWEYGTTTAYGSLTAPIALASPRDQEVESMLTGLTPDTDYHYRLVATNVFGTAVGADRTARTAVPAAPVATTSVSEVVGSSQARLAGGVAPNGTASTVWFEWGTTTAYGNVTPDQSVGALGESGFVAELSGLLATTEYHYRSVADNGYGQDVGEDQAFTTSAATLPFATTGAAAALGTTGMTMNGVVTPGGLATTYQFEYRPVGYAGTPTNTPLSPADAGYGTGVQGVTATTTNVNPSFAYEYRLVATNALGSHVGQFKSFTISPPAPPPTPPPAPPTTGGGSGGSGSLNLGVTVSTAKATPAPNETVEIRVTVAHKSGSASATQLLALIALPADATLLGAPTVDRGSRCTGATQLNCHLELLTPTVSTVVRFTINVGGVGSKVVTARLMQLQTDTNASDNSASVSLVVRAPAVPIPAAPGSGASTGAVKVLTGTNRANTLNGSAGRDLLRGLGGNDRLFGRGGADRLFGGLGNDRLVGGPGADTLEGGPGRDTIEARDGTRDVVRCGPGRDTVVADRVDWVARDCELVRRR